MSDIYVLRPCDLCGDPSDAGAICDDCAEHICGCGAVVTGRELRNCDCCSGTACPECRCGCDWRCWA